MQKILILPTARPDHRSSALGGFRYMVVYYIALERLEESHHIIYLFGGELITYLVLAHDTIHTCRFI